MSEERHFGLDFGKENDSVSVLTREQIQEMFGQNPERGCSCYESEYGHQPGCCFYKNKKYFR